MLAVSRVCFWLSIFIEHLRVEEKQVAGSFESIVAVLLQVSMFFPTDLIERFVEMLRDVKVIKHYLCLRRMFGHTVS